MATKDTDALAGFYVVSYKPSFLAEGVEAIVAAFVSRGDAEEYVAQWDKTMGSNGKHSISRLALAC